MSWQDLEAQARAWIKNDPDEDTRAELEALLGRGEEARDELAARFCGPLAFGTAGLRGVLGAGESYINRAVVLRTAHGLGAYLLEHEADLAKTKGVVIGYDGRRLSRVFAEDTAGVLCKLGIRAHLATEVCPTPLLAFAVVELGAAAGVMVTASHNPPEYNGYKVYAKNGAQIVPPMDSGIAAKIAASPAAKDIPTISLESAQEYGLLFDLAREVELAYLKAVRGLSLGLAGDPALGIVYTPLHGVGAKLVQASLHQAGFEHVHTVPEQADPDGEFPTVRFPNPEEPGALDLALALAREHQAPLLIANDPDADRLAAAVRTADGEYDVLSGNELGVLLGHTLLSQGEGGGERLVATTIVSSPQLGEMAASLGVRYAETLTGFKWIATEAIRQKAEDGARFVFGYEEALGYTVGEVVRDKDGVSAAMVLCELAAHLRTQGKTLLDALEGIAREHGLWVSAQRSTVYPGPDGPKTMAGIMDGLRSSPPEVISGDPVVAVRDYQSRERKAKDGSTSPLTLPQSNVLAFELASGSRVIARPSGTEPKLKLYFDLKTQLADGETYVAGRARARTELDALIAGLKV